MSDDNGQMAFFILQQVAAIKTRTNQLGIDGVIVTENEPRAGRPDNTIEEGVAEARAEQTIKDLDAGMVSRRSAENLRTSADRVVKGHNLSRGLQQRF